MTKLEEVARAICCPDGNCHVKAVKAREGGKYLLDLPCYATSPDAIAAARAAIEAMRVPTLQMKGDGWRATLGAAGISCADIERAWSAMVDAALSQAPENAKVGQ